MSTGSSIMSIQEMIEAAFGEADQNIVNFKLIHSILYILARQLRLLQRKVEIEIESLPGPVSSSLIVTEVKMRANVKRKKKIIKADSGHSKRDIGLKKSVLDKTTSEKHSIRSIKSETDKMHEVTTSKSSDRTSYKSTTDKTTTSSLFKTSTSPSSTTKTTTDNTTDKSTTDKTSTQLSSTEKSSSDRIKSSTEKSLPDKTKSSAEKSTSDRIKSTTELSSSDRTKASTEKPSSDRTKSPKDKPSSDKTKSSQDKSSSDKTKFSKDKPSSDKTKSSTDKTKSSTDKTKSSTDKTKSSTDKSSSDKTKSSTDKSSSDKTKSSTDKSSLDKTQSSTDKSSPDKTQSSTDKSSPDRTKSSIDKSSSDKTPSSTDKSSPDRTKSSTDRTSTEESLDKTSSDDSRKKLSSKDYYRLLESVELQREQELRVVNQRADSREEAKKIPTPITSLDEMEVQYEKLLIVERVPTDTDAREQKGRSRDMREKPLSVVTQEQFDSLAELVKELQEKFSVVGKAEFPENIQLMQDLRRGASLTDAMAALQLSARIEAAEKTLQQMMSLVTDLAVSKGIDISSLSEKDFESPETEVLFGAPGLTSQDAKFSRTTPAFKQPPARQTKKTTHEQMDITIPTIASAETVPRIEPDYENIQSGADVEDIDANSPKANPDWITAQELDEAMELMYDSLLKTIANNCIKSSTNAESALKVANRLERKIDDALNLDTRMDDLEVLVSEYAGQINTLDTGLSSYMTDYQEQLTQMQHDLEGGLESMAEAMANTGGDTAAVAELNSNITSLQMEFDATSFKQKKLQDQQNLVSADLESLWKQIEILRGTKSDREEVADALRDKAGLGALNGLISQEQFDAVRGDFEKRIGAAYDKFNNQEIIWQKAIDDLLRELNEKADWLQVASLRNDINDNLDKLRYNINEIMEIVGQPPSAAVAKKLFHDTTCLSCSSPAHMNLEEPGLIPALPAFPGTRPATIGAEDKSKPKEDGDHGLCYPGHPIPHPKDPRSHVCRRYCGGSHTLITGAISRAPVGMIITPVLRRITTKLGSDGRVYLTDGTEMQGKPCLPCNFLTPPSTHTPEPQEAPKIQYPSLDFLVPTGSMTNEQKDSVSNTPPPPLDD